MDLTIAQGTLPSNISSFYMEAQRCAGADQAGEATALEVSEAQNTLAQARKAYDDGLATL